MKCPKFGPSSMGHTVDKVKAPKVCTTKGVVKAKFVSTTRSRTLTHTTMIACREVAHTHICSLENYAVF